MVLNRLLARRGLLWLLIFALVALQHLGVAHRAVHSAMGPHAVSEGRLESPRRAASITGAMTGLFSAGLFSSHDDGDSTCRLLDQCSHADLAPLPLLPALPLVPVPLVLPALQGEALVRWAALFDARGPPSIR